MELVFEWDPRKDLANREKHRISFSEATSVFGDPLARIFTGKVHSADEQREIIIGHSQAKRLLLVCFTEREEGRVRIISARRATKREQHDYDTTSRPKADQDQSNGLKPEYRFDYANAKPNRFASKVRGGSLAVLLDPDVARVFQNAESVNTVLRALLTTMPTRRIRGTR